MKHFPGMGVLSTRHPMVVLIALTVFSLWDHGRVLNGRQASAEPNTSVTTSFPPQQKAIEIMLVGKRYVPPKRTSKIPSDLKKDGAELAVRAGDTIKLCNEDSIVYRPFSYSVDNKFGAAAGPRILRQGECMTYVVKNPTNKPVKFKLFDEIHATQKLYVVVLPANAPDEGEEDTLSEPPVECGAFAGRWSTNGGMVTIKISGDSANGTYDYQGPSTLNGTISGNTLKGQWSQPQFPDPDTRHGTMEFVLSADRKSFTGKWWDGKGTFRGSWNGTLIGCP
ncbi:MAG: hypothetical protein ABR555_07460 [Pyrinomonadaceae bacterium]